MAVWPFLVGLCLVLMLASCARRDRCAFIALALILFAYATTRAASGIEPFNLWAALIWGMCAGAVRSVCRLRVSPYLLATIPIVYAIAEINGLQPAFLSLPYVVIDLLAVAAMITARRKQIGGNNKGSFVGWNYHRRGVDARFGALGRTPY